MDNKYLLSHSQQLANDPITPARLIQLTPTTIFP